ncbi:MAG TPA: HAD family hydrolase [Candidatus Competibacteraceae bacterium]|nr:HAD family hydrolase [Candidatus Competibacteraceae bacterium]HRZ06412.1 HAD family hydrolase [Candidatus Competibacteraceae bacterium]HSA45193.1 HAD family hydrolase [Candidatus Competibacteraceae bacterium]
MIKAITFDLDDTLWDIWPVVERAEELLHDWLTVRYPRIPERLTPLELRELSSEVTAAYPERAYDRTWLRKEALNLAARRAGYQAFDVEGAFEVFFVARNAVEPFAEVRPTLERLGRRYLLASLSNGNADLRLIGLDDLFAFSLNAIDIGAAKPDPLLFKEASRRLAVRPDQIVHIGDDPEHDIFGAARAGFRTVWVNRTCRDWPGGPKADAEIVTLDELEPVLTAWEERG